MKVKITKLNEKNIRIRKEFESGSSVTNSHAAQFFAEYSENNNLVTVKKQFAPDAFSVAPGDLEIDGVPQSDGETAAVTLNGFIGNFKNGGANRPTPEGSQIAGYSVFPNGDAPNYVLGGSETGKDAQWLTMQALGYRISPHIQGSMLSGIPGSAVGSEIEGSNVKYGYGFGVAYSSGSGALQFDRYGSVIGSWIASGLSSHISGIRGSTVTGYASWPYSGSDADSILVGSGGQYSAGYWIDRSVLASYIGSQISGIRGSTITWTGMSGVPVATGGDRLTFFSMDEFGSRISSYIRGSLIQQ
jgi:hypothetical protein